MKREKIAILGGSFNPPTLAHLRIVQSALDQLGAERGIFIPSCDKYVAHKIKKSGRPVEDALPAILRVLMLEATIRDDPRLEVDERELAGSTGRTLLTLQEIGRENPDAELYYIFGGDKLDVLAGWKTFVEVTEAAKLIVFAREDYDPAAIIRENEALRERADALVVLREPEGISEISSTLVRQRAARGESIDDLLAPGATRLYRWEVAKKGAIIRFDGAVKALANDFPTPIKRAGTTFSSVEAALQAAKSLDPEVRARFKGLDASEARALGETIAVRPDWDEVKDAETEDLLRVKFGKYPNLKKILLSTENKELIDGGLDRDL